jgi:hypothetical protein
MSRIITKALKSYSINKDISLKELYELVGLSNENRNAWNKGDIKGKIQTDIQEILNSCNLKKSEVDGAISNLMIHFLYRNYKYNEDVSRELEFIYILKGVCSFDELHDNSKCNKLKLYKIRKFLKLSVWYLCIFPYEGFRGEAIIEFCEDNFPKQVRFAQNMIEVETLCSNTEIWEGKIINKSIITVDLIKRIEDRIARYGSSQFMKILISIYRDKYSNEDGLIRNKIPSLKFLLFLTLKVDTDKSCKYDIIRGRGKFEPKVIFRLTEAVEILNDNRVDNKYAFMFMDNPIEYLKKIIYYDSLYKDTQYPPESVLLLLSAIINDNKELFVEKFEMLPEQFLEISQSIIKYSIKEIEKGKDAKLSISPSDILKIINKDNKINNDVIIKYFEKMVASGSLNQTYDHPLKMDGITSDSEWLIPIREECDLTCYLPLPPIQCFGLYDKTMKILNFPNIGVTFENIVRKRLFDATYTEVYTGKYLYNNKVYESDGILILDKLVILIECKTKPLQRTSRSGNIGEAMTDLGLSFLYSTMQAYRCELSFREKGRIDLFDTSISDDEIKKGNATPLHVLQLPNDADFIRLSCTTFNYGTFIEKPVIPNLFSLFMGYKFSNEALKKFKKLQYISRITDELDEIWTRLEPYYIKNIEDEHDFFNKITFNTSLVPFGLLYMYTNNTSSSSSFKDKLKMYLYLVIDEYNSYTSLSYVNNLFFKS